MAGNVIVCDDCAKRFESFQNYYEHQAKAHGNIIVQVDGRIGG
jgi:uncharacterized C2H2 Zn-finger protein